jgi:hypothetical protein
MGSSRRKLSNEALKSSMIEVILRVLEGLGKAWKGLEG